MKTNEQDLRELVEDLWSLRQKKYRRLGIGF
jgi:hypothetical protein